MEILLIPEPVIMLLLGVGLVGLARFGRTFLKKNRPTRSLLSDSPNRFRLGDGLKKALAMVRFDK